MTKTVRKPEEKQNCVKSIIEGGTKMKHKTLAFLLTFVLIIGTLPLTVLADDAPFTFEKPTNLTAELKKDDDGLPYFELKLNIPQSVQDQAVIIDETAGDFMGVQCLDPVIEFEYKYGNYDWNEGPSIYWNTSDYIVGYLDRGSFEYRPFDSSTKFEDVDIKAETYSFRARFSTLWGYPDGMMDYNIYSDYSNIVTIGNPAYWSTASGWATPELQKAADAGIIPDILKGADMTKPITREEFAELSVLLYEKVTDKNSEPVTPNPFKDTTNPQILKAFKLGITTGTSANTFEPKKLINREQCATMLFRAIKAINPVGDYSIEGVKDFPDQKNISSWAVESTKYMSKIGIVKGDAKGNFMPKATTTMEEAAGYGMATREAAVLMTVRTYEKMK
jgi:hypothetical protein